MQMQWTCQWNLQSQPWLYRVQQEEFAFILQVSDSKNTKTQCIFFWVWEKGTGICADYWGGLQVRLQLTLSKVSLLELLGLIGVGGFITWRGFFLGCVPGWWSVAEHGRHRISSEKSWCHSYCFRVAAQSRYYSNLWIGRSVGSYYQSAACVQKLFGFLGPRNSNRNYSGSEHVHIQKDGNLLVFLNSYREFRKRTKIPL